MKSPAAMGELRKARRLDVLGDAGRDDGAGVIQPAPIVPIAGTEWRHSVTINVANAELHVMAAVTWWVPVEHDDGTWLHGFSWHPDTGIIGDMDPLSDLDMPHQNPGRVVPK